MAHLHDTGYGYLFSRADLVRKLLEVFALSTELYVHLVLSKAIELAEGLPPALRILIYIGDMRWNTSPEVFDLIQPRPAALTVFSGSWNPGCSKRGGLHEYPAKSARLTCPRPIQYRQA